MDSIEISGDLGLRWNSEGYCNNFVKISKLFYKAKWVVLTKMMLAHTCMTPIWKHNIYILLAYELPADHQFTTEAPDNIMNKSEMCLQMSHLVFQSHPVY